VPITDIPRLVRTGGRGGGRTTDIISHAAAAPRAIVPGIENTGLSLGRGCHEPARIHRRSRRRLRRLVARHARCAWAGIEI